VNPEVKKRLETVLKMAVESQTERCPCELDEGCEHCGWTGVLIPHRHSDGVIAGVLGACLAAMAELRRQGASDAMHDVLTWATAYIAPILEEFPPEESYGRLLDESRKGRALVEEARQGPSEPLSVDEMQRRLKGDQR